MLTVSILGNPSKRPSVNRPLLSDATSDLVGDPSSITSLKWSKLVAASAALLLTLQGCAASRDLRIESSSSISSASPSTDRAQESGATSSASSEPPVSGVGESAPGSVLDIAQTWHEGGLGLLLSDRELHAHVILLHFSLSNESSSERSFRYGMENFSATDTKGNKLPSGGVDYNGDPEVQTTCSDRTAILQAGETHQILIQCERGNFEGVAVSVDTADPEISGIVVMVNGLSSIRHAQWRVPLSH